MYGTRLMRAQHQLEGSQVLDAPGALGAVRLCRTQKAEGSAGRGCPAPCTRPYGCGHTHTHVCSHPPLNLIKWTPWFSSPLTASCTPVGYPLPLGFWLPCPQLREAEWFTVVLPCPWVPAGGPHGKMAQRQRWASVLAAPPRAGFFFFFKLGLGGWAESLTDREPAGPRWGEASEAGLARAGSDSAFI